MPQSAVDIVNAILDCYRAQEHCFVDALLIDDKDQRLKAGLACLGTKAECIAKINRSQETQRLIQKLEAHLNRTPGAGSRKGARSRKGA